MAASTQRVTILLRIGMRNSQDLVTRCRSRTVAKVDSIGLVVRRWIQCSAG